MSDTPETLAAILAEMRDPCAPRAPSLPALADRIETAVQRFVADDCAKCAHYNAATISLKDALDLANTIANHGTNANGLGDKASATIYALCHEVRTVRGEDANIKQEVQKLRRELRDIRRATGNAAEMREALLSAARAMEIESRISCTEKREIGKFGNTLSELCKRCRARDCECWQMTLKREVESALAAPARNCDRFATAEESFKGWESDNKKPPEQCFLEWLFATAEGGDHA